jgi:hypothetical protein
MKSRKIKSRKIKSRKIKSRKIKSRKIKSKRKSAPVDIFVLYKSHPDNTVDWSFPKINSCIWIGSGYDMKTKTRDVQFQCRGDKLTVAKNKLKTIMSKFKTKKYVTKFKISNKFTTI